MDLRAVKAAAEPELAACAIATARNAQGLLHDAEVLARAGCVARAYSLAALAVEECGKAASLTALAMLPRRLRVHAPVGRMLEWHQLKQVGGLLLAVVPLEGIGPRLAAMPAAEVAQVLCPLAAPAEEADRLKQRGFYVDMDRACRIREPSEITSTELAIQLARSRQVVASAGVLLEAGAQTRFANPPSEARGLAWAMAEALAGTGYARTPEAAADMLVNAVSKLKDRMRATDAAGMPDPSQRRRRPES